MAPSFVSQEEFSLFHNLDRVLYKILVISLSREPTQSMQVIALCLWLERVGYRNVVKKIQSLPTILISDVADELMECLRIIINPVQGTNDGNDIPILQLLLFDKPISPQFFCENHVAAARGVTRMTQDVCVRALTDIMYLAGTTKSLETALVDGLSRTQLMFGSVGSARENEVPFDGRAMFMTFSKGYPVSKKELSEFFAVVCGKVDCIEGLYMQEVLPREQPLFSRVVFYHASMVDKILRGEAKVKFLINGKHVWARKYVPKRSNWLPRLPPPTL